MSQLNVFRMALERQVNRQRRLREVRWRELCQRRAREAVQEEPAVLKSRRDVAQELHVGWYLLQFWETRFPELRPVKRRGAGRYYRSVDVELARTIRDLLFKVGYTLKGARKFLHERGVR